MIQFTLKNKKTYLSLFLLLLVTIFIIAGCGAPREDAAMSEPAMSPDYHTAESAPAPDMEVSRDAMAEERGEGSGLDLSSTTESQHKVIYTGEISMETLDFEDTVSDVTKYVNEIGGYTEHSTIEGRRIGDSSRHSRRYASFTFRVPEHRFHSFADQVREFGNVTSESTHGENITERYFDTEARLNSLQVQEERLLSLLEKADSIDDIMRIESELSNIRYQVESLTGTLQKWDNLIQFSTIHMTIREVDEITPDPDDPPGFLSDLQEALQDSILAVVESLKYLITFVIMAIPFVIVFGSIFMLLRKLYQKYIQPRRKFKKKKPTPSDE